MVRRRGKILGYHEPLGGVIAPTGHEPFGLNFPKVSCPSSMIYSNLPKRLDRFKPPLNAFG